MRVLLKPLGATVWVSWLALLTSVCTVETLLFVLRVLWTLLVTLVVAGYDWSRTFLSQCSLATGWRLTLLKLRPLLVTV